MIIEVIASFDNRTPSQAIFEVEFDDRPSEAEALSKALDSLEGDLHDLRKLSFCQQLDGTDYLLGWLDASGGKYYFRDNARRQ